MRRLGLLCLVAGVSFAYGCNVDPYCVENCEDGDGGVRVDGGDGGGDVDGGDGGNVGDGGPCVPVGLEVCNGIDDNCNGFIDEGNPGAGAVCSRNVGECREGMTACENGRLECRGGGVVAVAEICDGKDNDCDGTNDNGDPGGGPPCGIDTGECMRGTMRCMGGSLSCQGAVGPVSETCNGRDDNCNNMIDDGVADNGSCGTNEGECTAGTNRCVGGGFSCQGSVGPRLERCNGLDDDCNMMIDETFNLQTDIRNCGTCGNACGVPSAFNAVWKCEPASGPGGAGPGQCKVRFCQNGFFDINGLPGDGCEYACMVRGAEICNGLDDDCDGMTDELGVGGITLPSAATICRLAGACATPAPTVSCNSTLGRIVCNYNSNVETDGMGNIVSETRCDGLDNDCDGPVDEAYPTKGQACGNGVGGCRRTVNSMGNPATLVCNAMRNGVTCDAIAAGTAQAEVCDAVDNDCDGSTDETKAAPGTDARYVVEPTVRLAASLWVYQYEASRPDTVGMTQGTSSARACSRQNVIPWVNVTYPQARAACQAIGTGWDLCSEANWRTACRGTANCNFGMAGCNTYSTTQCNGNDFDAVAGGADDDAIFATGSPTFPMCTASTTFMTVAQSAFDMSGNVKEWTLARSVGINPLRGGSYNNTSGGMACDFNFTVADDTFQFNNVGFRCCSSTAP